MNDEILNGVLLDEDCMLTLGELSRACAMHAEWVMELVDEGILEPRGTEMARWQFAAPALHRARTVLHLQRDLGINLSGAALALELLDEIQDLRQQLYRLNSSC
ncbi:chaperone modulator CbpM [Thiolapillus sp.]|uniref:MerR family transcriptional regulator n=1 Tax=Thiolapillus brandeum TaxID=1076588 RepID=A0A831RUT3_9GAMM|nr:chaperone modulator CbpM [Thiolapillus sp.]HEC05324.1 MerR family transcriptional regulator [Thiolapillus brandeum]